MKQKIHGAIHAFFPHEHHIPQHPILKGIICILGIVGLFSMYLGSMGSNPVDAALLCDRPMCNDATDQPWLRQIPTMVQTGAGLWYKLGYYEYLPKQYAAQPTRKFPVIIFLHGVGEGGNGTTELSRVLSWGPPSHINRGFNFTFNVNGVEEAFIVLSPQAANGWFNPSDVDQLIERAKAKYRVDTERIYLMGLSAGGGGTWNYASNKVAYAQKLAAISPTCGAARQDPTNPDPNLVRDPKFIADANLPVRAFHGDADGTVGVATSRSWVSDINKYRPGLAKLKEYPGVGHNSWSQSMDPTHNVENPNVYEWFLQFRRTASSISNYYPIANAGADKVVAVPATVTLDGSASSDKDGTIATYNWKQSTGPSTATLSSTTTATTTVSNLINGVYTFTLTVKDDKGAVSIDTVTVSVKNKPVVVAGADKTITLPSNAVTLDVISTTDSDGWVAGNLWSQISGPNTATLGDPKSYYENVSNLVAGTYVFRITVTDNEGLQGYDDVTVTVLGTNVTPPPTPANVAPTANAGVDQTITLPTSSVSLDGVNSNDTDGTISTFSWKQFSGPSTSTITSTTTASKVFVSSLIAGTYVFELTVTDNKGATAKDQVTITVLGSTTPPPAATNVAPTANAGVDQTITLPTSSVSVDGLNSKDTDGSISTYSWKQFSGPSTSTIASTTTASKVTISSLISGTYVFELTVTDNKGATAKDQVTITVNKQTVVTPPTTANILPTITVGADKTITLPTNKALLDALATNDVDGWVVGGKWTQTSGPSTASIPTPTAYWAWVENLVAGTYVFRQTVTDNKGGQGYDEVTVTVNNSATVVVNQNPIGYAGVDQTITLPLNTVTLDGASSYDPDGTISSYSWKQINGNAATLTNATAAKATVSNLTAGTYTFQLTVTDNKGSTSIDTISIVVNPAIVVTPPVVNTAGRVLIDIGTNNDGLTSFKDARGKTWNVVNDVNPGLRISNALDINNVSTTIGLNLFSKLYGDFYGVGGNGDGTNRVGSSTDIGDYPTLAVQDSAFIDNTLTSNGQWKITGLDPKKVYSFKFRGARYGDTQTIRGLKMKLSSDTTWKSVSQTNNADPANAIVFSSISGVTEVTFDIRVQDGARYGYINLIDITYK